MRISDWSSDVCSSDLELGGIVEEIVEGLAGIEAFEMLLGDLERLVSALLDRDGRHDDHEFGEAETLVQLEERAEVNIGLVSPRLHFEVEVAGPESRRRRQTVEVGRAHVCTSVTYAQHTSRLN